MLDLRLIRSDPGAVRAALARRGDVDPGAVDALLALDTERRAATEAAETL
ncbi:MAG: serine--tRNA ligase, partial [Actinomycetota bacterium]|nr:serine--tRNA ligase [Actinomycetota bacterium]